MPLFLLVLMLSPSTLALSDIDTTGTADGNDFTEGGSQTLTNSISGNAATADSATFSLGLTCTNCIGGPEVDESSLSGLASSLTAGDLSCTDCLNETEIQDVFLLNTGDVGTGTYSFEGGVFHIDATRNLVGFNTANPDQPLHVEGQFYINHATVPVYLNGSGFSDNSNLWRLVTQDGFFRIDRNTNTDPDFSTYQSVFKIFNDGTIWLGGTGADIVLGTSEYQNPTMVIQPDAGNVGIGTQDPNNLLHLYDEDNDNAIELESSTDWVFGLDKSDGGRFKATQGLTFGTNDFFTVWGSNLGIGTTSPEERLHVHTSLKETPADLVEVGVLLDGDMNLSADFDVYVVGKYAYLPSFGDDGLTIIDISDRTNPRQVGFVSDSESGGTATTLDGAFGVKVVGNYAYVTALLDNGLSIIDISNPSAPVEVGYLNDSVTLAGIYGLDVSGGYAYLCAGGTEGLVILDVSDPTDPFITGFVNDSEAGGTASMLESPWDVEVRGKYAYVTAWDDNALSIIDVSDPTNPVEIGAINDSFTGGTATAIRNPSGVAVAGRYAYVTSDADNAVAVIDVSDPANPVEVANISDTESGGTATVLDGPTGLFLAGDFLYVAAYDDSGLSVIDISDPTAPVEVATIVDGGEATSIEGIYSPFVSGRYAYVPAAIDEDFTIIDLQGYKGHAATIGNLDAGTLHVTNELDVGNNLFVHDSVSVGPQGAFSQGEVHVSGNTRIQTPTMYLTISTLNGTHDCDDDPDNCCYPGYHMCTAMEFLYGGRQIEDLGAYDRDGTPVATYGDVDPGDDSSATDCTGWTSDSSSQEKYQCQYSTALAFSCTITLNDCHNTDPIWCCSD